MFIKTLLKKKMFYREYMLTNTFNPEFDMFKRSGMLLEKFVRISGKEYYLTITTSPHKYFFMAICCKTKDFYIIALYRKKMEKLLDIYNDSLKKI